MQYLREQFQLAGVRYHISQERYQSLNFTERYHLVHQLMWYFLGRQQEREESFFKSLLINIMSRSFLVRIFPRNRVDGLTKK